MKYVDKRFLGFNVVLAAAAAAILLWIALKADEYALKVQQDLRIATTMAKADRSLATLMETVLEAETGQRGYLLTRRESFLDDLAAARAKALGAIADYHSLRAGLGDAAPAVDVSLRDELEAKFAELARTVDLARAGEIDAALDIVRDETGKEAMRRIMTASTEARDKLAAFRLHYRQELSDTAERLRRTNMEGAIDILALSVVAIGAISWHNRQLVRARSELRQANQQLEARVRERTRQLVRSNEEIQRYTHIIGHDLRAPLVNIMGFTRELAHAGEVLKAYVDAGRAGTPFEPMKEVYAAVDEDCPEALRFIQSSLARMDALIAAILQLSRLGRATLHPQRIDMRELVEDCLAQIQLRLVESGGEATIVAPLPDIVSDANAVKQIFTNVLDNAVKYFARDRPGKIVISGEARGDLAFFEIRDNGRGIAPRDHERVFDLFRRAGPQDQPGEGVGLAHVRSLTRRLGGEIDVESDGVAGSAFRFSLARHLDVAAQKKPIEEC